MAAKVGALLVDMAMNTAAFASDLSKSTSSLNSWATSSNKTLAGVVNGFNRVSHELKDMTLGAFTLRNALLSVVGGGALGLFIKDNLEAASAVADTADNIGVTTKTLQEYTYAARLSGVGTEQLQTSLTTFATSLGQAHAGAGKLYGFLKESNPILLQQVLSAKSVDEALDAVFGTMGKLASQTDRLALTSASFGKKNLEMVNLVKDGVPAFEALRAKANELGLVIDDKLIHSAEEAGDKVDTLAQVFHAQLTTAVAENAESIGHLAEGLTDLVPKVIWLANEAVNLVNIISDQWEPATIELGVTFATMAINAQKAWLMAKDAATLGFTDAGQKIKELDEQAALVAEEAAQRLDDLKNKAAAVPHVGEPPAETKAKSDAIAGYAAHMKELADRAKEAEDSFKKLKAAADKIKSDGQGAFSNYIHDVAELDKMLKANLLTWEEYSEAVRQAQEKNFHTSERVKKVLGDTQNAQEKYNEQMRELNQLRGVEGGLSEEQYAQAVAKTSGELRKAQMEGSLFGDIMDKAIDGNIKSWKDLGGAVVDFGKTLLKNLANGQGFGNAFGGSSGGGLLGGLGGLAGLAGSLFGGGQAASFIGPPQQGLFGGIGSFLTSFFHGGGMVGSGGSQRRISAGAFDGAPRFHSGGIAGDEVPAILKKGERVQTEQQQREGGRGGNTYYIDARGADIGVEERLRNLMESLSMSIEPRAVSAVVNARNRNPNIFT